MALKKVDESLFVTDESTSTSVWLDDLFLIDPKDKGYQAHLRCQRKKILLLVDGYGTHFNSPLGWIYLPMVARVVKENAELIAAIIFSGAVTEANSSPYISEAYLMCEYIRRYIKDNGIQTECVLILNDDAFTSFDNSRGMSTRIKEVFTVLGLCQEDVRIIHCCEATRAWKVVEFDRKFMLPFVESIDDITVKPASWERESPMSLSLFLIDWLMVHVRYFAKMMSAWRQFTSRWK